MKKLLYYAITLLPFIPVLWVAVSEWQKVKAQRARHKRELAEFNNLIAQAKAARNKESQDV